MVVAAAVNIDVADARYHSFGHAADKVLCHIVTLVNAINRLSYPIAWLMACELGRAIVQTECVVLHMPSGPERARATVRLGTLREVAMRALACAPCPSPLAIAQARSTEPGVDRSAWASEEQQWITAREAARPLCITSHGEGLTIHSLVEAHPQ